MIIQVILVAGLLVCLLVALAQRRVSRLVRGSIALTSLVGIYLVLFPEQTNRLAQVVGVGRGADLVLYCWIVISLVASVNLYFRLMRTEAELTELTRELALRAPAWPSDGPAEPPAAS